VASVSLVRRLQRETPVRTPLALVIGLGLILGSARSIAAPPVPVPSLSQVMKGDLRRERFEWLKIEDGKRVIVRIGGGFAERANPNWAPAPSKLKYDLARNQELIDAFKHAKLGASSVKTPESTKTRTLVLLAAGASGYVVIGQWTKPEKVWKRALSSIYDQLEPLMNEEPEVFAPLENRPRGEPSSILPQPARDDEKTPPGNPNEFVITQ
jgi:hypothetical protein